MGDYPVDVLGGRTPLQAADAKWMRRIAARARLHNIRTVPMGMPPGSDVCNMGLLGYNAAEKYTGRAPIEAAGAGITLAPDEVAFRCNLVTVKDGRMADYSAGHLSAEEGATLAQALGEALNTDGLTFHPGVGYRHLLIWRNGPDLLTSMPPHEISGQSIDRHLPSGPRQEEVHALMARSKAVLVDHPVNQARRAEGRECATQIWLWGQGRAISLSPLSDRFGLSGGVITAVDLIRGLGQLAGLEAPRVEGATGFIDTNYDGKVQAAKEVLRRHPFVFVHLEAPDECGHMGDAALKVQAISDFDAKVVGPLWRYAESLGMPYRLVLATDHRTPIALRGHTGETVPMAVLDGPVGDLGDEDDEGSPFDESILNDLPEEWSYDVILAALSERHPS